MENTSKCLFYIDWSVCVAIYIYIWWDDNFKLIIIACLVASSVHVLLWLLLLLLTSLLNLTKPSFNLSFNLFPSDGPCHKDQENVCFCCNLMAHSRVISS